MQALTLLNGLTPQQFMQEYWQKKPLLIRGAIPAFEGVLDANALAGLACDYEMPSRIIRFDPERMMQGESWQVLHGPFNESDFAGLPESHWTLLVQGINHYLPEAEALLQRFNFIPYARLDDLMVSYAPQGGGVGPHVDSYDVFLLQGTGKRRWQISQQSDLQIIPDAPLRILSNFRCEQEWILEAGDMLYLPPNVAHWGIAEDNDCMTYSVGFRAPARRELAVEFLDECRQAGLPDEIYQDPELLPASDPSEISSAMVHKVANMLRELDWAEDKLGPFLARYLSEPKSYMLFQSNRKLTIEKFRLNILKKGIRLDLQTQMLHWRGQFFMNGEIVALPAGLSPILARLSNKRMLTTAECSLISEPTLLDWLYAMYQLGYLHCDQVL